jgi:hypothetical protein
MGLHAPSKGWFSASLMIAVSAVVGALSPIPYITTYATWVAILAYIVLAVGNLAQTDVARPATPGARRASENKCHD